MHALTCFLVFVVVLSAVKTASQTHRGDVSVEPQKINDPSCLVAPDFLAYVFMPCVDSEKQDMRLFAMIDDNDDKDSIVCNNEKLASAGDAEYVLSCKHFLTNTIFGDETWWPAAIFAPAYLRRSPTTIDVSGSDACSAIVTACNLKTIQCLHVAMIAASLE